MTQGRVAAAPATPDPPAVTAVNEHGGSRFVLLCEHASNHIPPAYGDLGLPPEQLVRHIAWDIGAADLALRLSALLDAPLFLSGCSRLVIDLNRPLWAPTSIPVVSEATEIPGNRGLSRAERLRRAATWFTPFHARVAQHLDERASTGRAVAVVGIHSFTPVFLGQRRPWHAGVLYARAAGFGASLRAGLGASGDIVVGDNEPYRIEAAEDYTVPVHGDQRGIDAALIEVRQDLLGSGEARAAWAARLTTALNAVTAARS